MPAAPVPIQLVKSDASYAIIFPPTGGFVNGVNGESLKDLSIAVSRQAANVL